MSLPEGEYYYSASQVETFRDCRRKWFFKSVAKLPVKKNKYAEAGDIVHEMAEDYLSKGIVPDINDKRPAGETGFTYGELAKVFVAGVRHLPRPGTARVEQKFELYVPGLGIVIGFIDFEYTDDNGKPRNGDHKTTSNLAYAKTEEDLQTDPQSVIYAVHTMEKHNVDEMVNVWVYYHRAKAKKPKTKKVEAIMRLSEVDKQWQTVLTDLHEMKRLRDTGAKAEDVEYNVRACDMYGGCPFRTQCGLTPADRMKGLMKMVNLKDKMKAQMEKKAEAAPAAPAAAPAPAGGNPLLAKMKARAAPAPAPTGAGDAVNPPEATQQEEKPKAVFLPVVEKAKPAPAPVQGYTLFVDCSPQKHPNGTQSVAFSTIAAPVLDALREQYGSHYRLVPDTYGGAPALFSEAMRQYLQEKKFGPNVGIVLTLASQEARDAYEVMVENAGVVIRGHA